VGRLTSVLWQVHTVYRVPLCHTVVCGDRSHQPSLLNVNLSALYMYTRQLYVDTRIHVDCSRSLYGWTVISGCPAREPIDDRASWTQDGTDAHLVGTLVAVTQDQARVSK